MPLTNTYLVEGENGFIGMQSRNNPLELKAGYVQLSQNMRLDRGTAAVRLGLKRLTSGASIGVNIYGASTFSTSTGTEYIILLTGSGLFSYNTSTLSIGSIINYPTGRTITATDNVDIVQANNVAYIFRGQGDAFKTVTSITHVTTLATATITAHGYSNGDEVIITGSNKVEYNGSWVISAVTANTFQYTMATAPSADSGGTVVCQKAKAPLVWDGATTITVVPQGVNTPGAENMPTSDFGLYFKNRLILKQTRDSICASDYLDYNTWDLDFAQFFINVGANDFIVGFQPWQEDKFIIFQRNSMYYAYVDPNGYTAGAAPGGTSFIQSLTSEFGCSARRSIVNAGEYIFFLSDNGVYLLNPSLDLKLLGNTTPLSDPISDVIARINTTAVSKAVGKVFNNRYYLAIPIDGSTRNNAVIVYSLLNKAWESVDTFPTGFYVDSMSIALYGQAKRLYFINQEYGIFLSEELAYDELTDSTGSPVLPFVLPATMTTSFQPNAIAGQILTRRYFYDTYASKRFSYAEADLNCNAGDSMTITAIATNPDNTSEVFSFASSGAEDFTKRFRIGKRGFGLDLKLESVTGRPTLRGLRISATMPGKNVVSEE